MSLLAVAGRDPGPDGVRCRRPQRPAGPATTASAARRPSDRCRPTAAAAPVADRRRRRVPAELEAWLDHVVGRPEPDPELADQLAAGRLTARSLYLLLFEARPARAGARHRAAAWDALVAAPSQAPGVLSMHTQARSWPPAAYLELGEHTALGYVTTPDGPVVGEPAVAAGIRAARASAALALVRDLAPPDPGRRRTGSPRGRRQSGRPAQRTRPDRRDRGPDLHAGRDGPRPPAGLHLYRQLRPCRGPLRRHRRGRQQERGEGGRRRGACWSRSCAAERTHLARLARARREQARSPEGIFTRLLRAGCPVDFTGWGLRIGGHLARAAGRMRAARPVRPAGPGHPRRPGPSIGADLGIRREGRAGGGRRAARLPGPGRRRPGLLAARPARPDRRHADPAVAQFFDPVADTLLRPPGARLVVGDLPYAGRPRPLDPDAADWADRAAEAAEADRRRAPGDPPRARRRATVWPLRAAAARAGRSPEALAVPGGGRVRRRACSAARSNACCAGPAGTGRPLERVRRDGTLTGAEAAAAPGPGGGTAGGARDHRRVAGRAGHRQRPGGADHRRAPGRQPARARSPSPTRRT